MVKLTEYNQVLENDEVVDYEEKQSRMKKEDLKGATIDGYSTANGLTELLVTLKDGRKIHILPGTDGESLEFALWKEEQPAGVTG